MQSKFVRCSAGRLGGILVIAALFSAGAAPAATQCEALSNFKLEHGVVTAAQAIGAGAYAAPDHKSYSELPGFCRVAVTLTPTAQSDIKVEVWMPDSNRWNGRFAGTGNGGYAGSISYSQLAATLRLGFAAANTDMGTSSGAPNGRGLTGQREKQTDWGYRATHVMTVAAKQIVSAYYGHAPEHSYFSGCSTGGSQALHEASRFPQDYDGIVAGAPAENRTHVHMAVLWAYSMTHKNPDSTLSVDQLKLVTKSVVSACSALGGGLSSDPYLNDPRACHWNANELLCKAGQTSQCLNASQVKALNTLYDGTRNPRTGELIYPGIPRGSESDSPLDLEFLEGVKPLSQEPGFTALFYWVFGPNWRWQTFDFDRDVAKVDAQLAPILNANNADLSAFKARGGKLLMYHGWADATVPAQDGINYFLRASRTQSPAGKQSSGLTAANQFVRLFMAPGMGHCGGGAAPNVFGGANNPGGPADADHNALLAVQKWVEQGVAPEKIIATKYANNDIKQPATMTRPLCVFPKLPHYKGSGDTNAASNFTCVDNHITSNPAPALEYLK